MARCTNRDDVQFPFLCLLVSGGHNLLMVVRGVGNYLQVGSTLDDALGTPPALLPARAGLCRDRYITRWPCPYAAPPPPSPSCLGEAYDKIARMLGLDMRPSGGAALELIAREGNPKAYKYTRCTISESWLVPACCCLSCCLTATPSHDATSLGSLYLCGSGQTAISPMLA